VGIFATQKETLPFYHESKRLEETNGFTFHMDG
jgi:hypothetical protein